MRIIVIDDNTLFREGLVSLLKSQADIQVIGQGGSVAESVEIALELNPEIILMDFTLPDGTGLDATRLILKDNPSIKIIFLTIHEDDERLFAAIRSGAKGYLLKNLSVVKLLASLRAVERGEPAITRVMMSRIMHEFANTPEPDQAPPQQLLSLTAREIEIIRELSTGASNSEIARRMFISENTVKNHIHNILEKLNMSSRREAIAFANRYGLNKRSL